MQRLAMIVVGLAAVALAGSALAKPPAHTDPQSKVHTVDAEIAAARAQHTVLQAQVDKMEQQNVAQQAQLQQRNAEIAALQQKLRAAGVPASAASAGN